MLAYTGALVIATAFLFGLAPAVRAARADFGEVLRAHSRGIAGERLRLPRLLVAIQLALCLAALVAAGLLGRSLSNLKWIDVGFDREHLAYASSAAGLLLGLPCANAIASFLRTALFGLQPLDPRTAAAALATLLTVALVAAWIPARRAASIDPIRALRDD